MDKKKNSPGAEKNVRAMIAKLLSLPKTLYLNFKCFPFKTACRLPVLISYRVKITRLKRGCIGFGRTPYPFMVKIGFGGAKEYSPRRGNVCLGEGRVIFGGQVDLGEGIILANAGRLTIGGKTYVNSDCTIWCEQEISIGEDNRFGWGVELRDSDGHPILDQGQARPFAKAIFIGNHCWLCSESAVLKGGAMAEGSVLGFRAVLTKACGQKNTLLVGMPAKPVKTNISWPRGEEEARVRALIEQGGSNI